MHRLRYLILLALLAAVLPARARVFHTLPEDPRNVVEFVSDATLEKIVGRTSKIQGSVDLDLGDLLATKKARFEVDLTTIDTGIAQRNMHMRDNHLETAQYPTTTFTLTKFVAADKTKLEPGQSAQVMAVGELALHGVTKSYEIPLTLFYDRSSATTQARLDGGKGDILTVSGEWTVKLSDHHIARPDFLFLRLAEEIKIQIKFATTDAPPKAMEKETGARVPLPHSGS